MSTAPSHAMRPNFWQILGALMIVLGIGYLIYERTLPAKPVTPATDTSTTTTEPATAAS